MAISDNKTFKAIANCTFSLDLNSIPEVKEFNKTQLTEFDVKYVKQLPVHLLSKVISLGDELTFGDKIEMEDDGFITVFPKEVFAMYSSKVAYLPNEARGQADALYDVNTLKDLTPNVREALLKNKDAQTSRYKEVKFLSKVV